MIIDIDKEFLEKCGTNSLQGLLLERGVLEPQEVTLRFKQTSFGWRQQNGGPELYIMPEFAPYCLLESVLALLGRGFKIKLDWHS